jgi:hypothetical protein
MNEDRSTTKISKEGLRKLRIIAALTGERQYEVLDRLLGAELERVQKEQKPG